MCLRLLLVLFIATIIFYQLPPPIINSEELTKVQQLNETYLKLPQSISDRAYPDNFEQLIWRILYFYNSQPNKVCFVNKGTFIQFGDGTVSDSVLVEIEYNNQEVVEVKQERCFKVKKDETQFTFKWGFGVDVKVNETIEKGGRAVLYPKVKTQVLLGGYFGQIMTFIVVFLFAGSLLWLWKGCIDFILQGWFKKS